ncbi:MAG: helix-turn-helix transcriptional regulator, partial [Oscillospiraceae bacterium]|nr:helix-turn-helix transcriptional regulator [Oscillospiraceae bacterium]
MNLSEKILYCRRRAGLSQEALAERLGVSRQAVSKWETGDATPELDKLRALAETFRVTADWLLSDAEPDAPAQPRHAPGPD